MQTLTNLISTATTSSTQPTTQLRIDDDKGGQGELSKTIVCKTLAEYGYAAYQLLSMTMRVGQCQGDPRCKR